MSLEALSKTLCPLRLSLLICQVGMTPPGDGRPPPSRLCSTRPRSAPSSTFYMHVSRFPCGPPAWPGSEAHGGRRPRPLRSLTGPRCPERPSAESRRSGNICRVGSDSIGGVLRERNELIRRTQRDGAGRGSARCGASAVDPPRIGGACPGPRLCPALRGGEHSRKPACFLEADTRGVVPAGRGPAG